MSPWSAFSPACSAPRADGAIVWPWRGSSRLGRGLGSSGDFTVRSPPGPHHVLHQPPALRWLPNQTHCKSLMQRCLRGEMAAPRRLRPGRSRAPGALRSGRSVSLSIATLSKGSEAQAWGQRCPAWCEGRPPQQGPRLGAGCGRRVLEDALQLGAVPARSRAATRGKWRPTVTMCHRSRARYRRDLKAQGPSQLSVGTEAGVSIHPSLPTPGLAHQPIPVSGAACALRQLQGHSRRADPPAPPGSRGLIITLSCSHPWLPSCTTAAAFSPF